MQGGIVVVGSANLDLVVRVARHPSPGETLIGSDYARHPGGKGANQAVAAARLGADVAFVGRVGEDEFGAILTASLRESGVDVSRLRTVDRPTGVAFIQVDEQGQNSIVVSPGANSALSPAAAREALAAGCKVLCLQLEVPLETVLAAAAAAHAAGASVLLNLAPARPLSEAQLEHVSHLLVNEHEAASLLGVTAADVLVDPEAAARRLARQAPNVVLTLGERGAAWARRGEGAGAAPRSGQQPAFEVAVVDTTAAGDAFAGALASRLARGDEELQTAVRYASAAAALTTTRQGAQPSLPSADEVAELLERAG